MSEVTQSRTVCPNCGKRFVLPGGAEGRKVRCSACEFAFIARVAPAVQLDRDVANAAARTDRIVIVSVVGCVALVVVGLTAWVHLAMRPAVVHEVAKQSAEPAAVVTAAPELSTAELIGQVEKSVAMIEDDGGVGTGFVVAENVIATNHHVVKRMVSHDMKVRLTSSDQELRVAGVVYEDEASDIAFLWVTCNAPALKPASIGFQRGLEVVAIGNPGVGYTTLANAVASGLLSAEVELLGKRVYQLSMSINPGNSGGPVVSAKHGVIGMISFRAKQQEGLAFAVPASQIWTALNEHAQQMTQSQRLAAVRRHDFRACINQAENTGLALSLGLSSMRLKIGAALDDGRSVNSGLEDAYRAIGPLDNFKDDVARTKKRLERLADREGLPRSAQRAIEDLLDCISSMYTTMDSPTGTYAAFSALTLEMDSRWERVLARFKEQIRE